jgi:putative tricarboxylic transport membrane protein
MAIALTAKLLWAIVGLAVIWLAARLGVGSVADPGPGMLSWLLGIVMTVLGFAGAAQVVLGRGAMPPPQPWTADMIVRSGAVVILLAAYATLLERVGFLALTFALMLILLVAFARLRWMRATALAATLSIAIYALFKLALGTQLPAGILG